MNFIPNSVAIATDHGLLRKSLSQFIASNTGLEIIHETDSGANLLAQIRNTYNVPHICILDVWQANEKKCENLTADLKGISMETRVLVLLSGNNAFLAKKLVGAGVNCVLPINCSDIDLINALGHLRNSCKNYKIDLPAFQETRDIQQEITFSSKERKFLSLCCSELTYKEIADKMNLSLRAIESIRESLFKKLSAASRTGLVIKALKNGLISL